MPNFIVRWLSLVQLRGGKTRGHRVLHAARSSDASRRTREITSFRGVELRTRGAACREAKALRGKRMLAAEAPPLPLKGCHLRCGCYYIEHEDRRSPEPRRRVDAGVSGAFYTGPERRSGLDRRRSSGPTPDNYYEYMRDRERDQR